LAVTVIVLSTAMTGCNNENPEPDDIVESPKYIALNKQDLGNQFDYAILGRDGLGYFFEFKDENSNIPKRITRYDGNKSEVDLVFNFDETGLPKNILSENFTIVLGNYDGNRFDGVVITKDGESQMFENIETDLYWDEYMNGIGVSEVTSRSSLQLRSGSDKSLLGWIGLGFNTVTCFFGNYLGCAQATLEWGEVIGWWETPQFVNDALFLKDFVGLVTCGSNYWNCFESIVGLITYEGENMENSAQNDISLGEGILQTGNGIVKLTLIWDNYADIDLHCIDPAGEHIYFARKYSSTGGFLDYDNTVAYGPENIYFNPAPEGTYRVYIHYYAAKYAIRSVNYKVAIFQNNNGQVYEGTISGVGSIVEIATFTIGTSSRSNTNANNVETVIDWNNLSKKSDR